MRGIERRPNERGAEFVPTSLLLEVGLFVPLLVIASAASSIASAVEDDPFEANRAMRTLGLPDGARGSSGPDRSNGVPEGGAWDDGCPMCGRVQVLPGRPHHWSGIHYGQAVTKGRLPHDLIQRIAELSEGRYRFCYQSALHANPSLSGRVTVNFMINRRGEVSYIADGGSDLPDQVMRQCIARSFQSLSFPEPESGMVSVTFSIVFGPM